MSFLYILLLGLLVVFCAAVGQGQNAAAMVATIVFFPAVIALYFSPAIVAHSRKHRQRMPIAVLNALLGWTMLGWVVALVWAYTAQAKETAAAQ